jgi:hypothetical protein
MLLDRHKRVETAIYKIQSKFFQKDEMVISRRNITLSNYTNGAVVNLVGGNFFTGFLLLLNADDAFIGLMTAITLIGNLLQVLSPLLLERFTSRKRLLIFIRIFFYLFNIVLIGIIPYLGFTDSGRLAAVLVVQVALSLINAVSAPGFAIWHIKSIPEAIRARYYSMLTISNPIIMYVLILSASAMADRFKATGDALQGLLVLRFIALVFAGLDIYFLFKVKEYPNRQEGEHATIRSILLTPFKEKKYMLTVWISCLWSFTANIPGPFFSIYLLRDLGISYSYINLISMLNIPVLLLLTPFWARRIQHTSWFGTLSVSMGFYIISYLGLSFVNSNTMYLYPVFMIIAFLFSPGINLTFANIPYINIPESNQTRYIGFYLTMNSLAALIATALGRKFILLTAAYRIRLLGAEMQNKQYILLVTAFLMLLAAIAISFLRKKAEGKTGEIQP